MTDLVFSDSQISIIAARAKAALPAAANGRVEKAERLLRSSSVELHPDGSATVLSESDGLTGYLVQQGRCTCPDFQFQPPEVEGWCAHRIAAGMARRWKWATLAQPGASTASPPATIDAKDAKEAQVSAETSPTLDANLGLVEGKNGVSAPGSLGGLSDTLLRGVIYIHGKPFIRFSALLAEAHARGLQKLETTFVSVTADLALAQCTATFADGRVFTDVADSSPSNVGAQVRAHWPRLSATRAAARALRNGLALEMCSVEELADV